jgi:hypothetical protein
MAVIATPLGAAVVCGLCSTRFKFGPSIDRCLPLPAALAAGSGTARTDKGVLDHACPDCLACRTAEGPIVVPDDPRGQAASIGGSTKAASACRSSGQAQSDADRRRAEQRHKALQMDDIHL